ncbi:MAG: aminotransferase class V-fold PLP-dependent enzyme [Bacteroidales bacterium]|nr:aminotransferase class V-fold PLP-dependent enzyme [Bacteroidales bacterium]
MPTTTGNKAFINFDNGASTPTFIPIWNTVWNVWQQPEILHKEMIPEVKTICSKFLNAPESIYDILFTSNTTEAINLVAENLSFAENKEIEPVVLNTYLEHNSNELPWRNISGHKHLPLSVDSDGFINLPELEATLKAYNKDCIYGKQRIIMVAVTGASNVMGSYNNLEEISRIAHHYKAQLLVDAAQMVAHKKTDVLLCNIDYLAFSAHKTYAPFGTGVLLAKKELLNFPQSIKQQIIQSGEANVGGIAALGKALLLLEKIGMHTISSYEKLLTSHVLNGLAKNENISVFGLKQIDASITENKGGVIVFIAKNALPSKTANQLAFNEGIGVRYGCHCAHIMVKKIHNIGPGLEKFQGLITRLFPKVKLPGVVRISFGIYNTITEVDTFLESLEESNISKKEIINKATNKKQIIELIKQETIKKIFN